jgi:predicted GNAT family N-acyltransferase
MALRQIEHNSNDYKKMVSLRDEMLRKPLGLAFTAEELAREKEDILIGAFEDDELLACCLLTKHPNNCLKLRQMAVTNNIQGKGIGASIMHFAENLARDRGATKIIMNARKTAVGFYQKLGYNVCSEEFVEVTLPHFVMEKML